MPLSSCQLRLNVHALGSQVVGSLLGVATLFLMFSKTAFGNGDCISGGLQALLGFFALCLCIYFQLSSLDGYLLGVFINLVVDALNRGVDLLLVVLDIAVMSRE